MFCTTLSHVCFDSRHGSGAYEVVFQIQMVPLYKDREVGHVLFSFKTETGWVGGVQK